MMMTEVWVGGEGSDTVLALLNDEDKHLKAKHDERNVLGQDQVQLFMLRTGGR